MTGYLDGLDGVPAEYSANVLERLEADSVTLLASEVPEHGLSCREEAEQLFTVVQRLEMAAGLRVARVKTSMAYKDGERTFGSAHAWMRSGAKMTGAQASRYLQTGQQMVAEIVSQIWADVAADKAPLAAAQLSSNAITKLDKKLRDQAKNAREFAKGRILAGLDPIEDPTDPNAYMCIETEAEADRRISHDIEVYAAILAQLDRQAETLRDLRRAIALLNAKYDPDGVLDAWESTQDKRHLTLWEQDDGCGAGKFVLPPEAAAKLKALLDKYAKRTGPEDLRTKEQRQGDVLIGLLEQAVATELLVIVDAATLLDDPNGPCDCPNHQPGKYDSSPTSEEPAPTLFDNPSSDSDISDEPGENDGDDEPADDEPADDEPADDEPADDEPADDEPGDRDSDAEGDTRDGDTDDGNDDGNDDGKFGFNMNGRWRGRTQDADLDPNGAPANGGPDPRLHDLGCIDSMSAKVRDVLERFRRFDPDRDDPSMLDRPCDQGPPHRPPGPHRPSGQRDPRDPDKPHTPQDHPGGRVFPVSSGQRCPCCGRAPLNLDFRNSPGLIVSTGALMPAPIVRQRAYTSTLYRIVLQGRSVPVNASTATRAIPEHADRAMRALYSHCVYDTCVMPIEWAQRDHMYEFEHHGRTHPAEIAPGCWWHNGDRGAHPDKYIREKLPDGKWHVRTDPNWVTRPKRKKNH